jgi:hypothetical protein
MHYLKRLRKALMQKVEFLMKWQYDVKDYYPDIPFVVWHYYERVKIDLYLDRYGYQDGIDERVKKNLLDLLPITQHSASLPFLSYIFKVVEK